MWGTPQGSRKTVTECSSPGSFSVPLVTESADRARCSRVCLLLDDRREAAARGLALVKWIAEYAKPRKAKRPTAIFQECRGCIACEVSSPLCRDFYLLGPTQKTRSSRIKSFGWEKRTGIQSESLFPIPSKQSFRCDYQINFNPN